jgi:hypothetical protein
MKADGLKLGGREQADQTVGLGTEQLGGLRRADGDGEDEPPGIQAAQGQERRAGRYAGGEAVVHEYCRTGLKVGVGAVAAEELEAPCDLRGLPLGDPILLILGVAQSLYGAFVEAAHAAGGYGADTELRLAGGPELTRDDDVQRRVQRA